MGQVLRGIALTYAGPRRGRAYGITLGLGTALTAFYLVMLPSSRVGGFSLLAAVLPGSLCCTSIIPSLLAVFGASVPTILGTTGKIASVFALYEGVFIAASLAGVALSIVLAARSRAAHCLLPHEGSPP